MPFIWLLLNCISLFAQKPVTYLHTKISNSELLENLLEINSEDFSEYLHHKRKYEIQIIYTQVNHKTNGAVELIQHAYNLQRKNYFYPASLVKLPVSVLALEKCHQLQIPTSATMITLASGHCQKSVSYDSTAYDLKPSVANYIKRMMLVSDNDSYSRIYEFLGADFIKKRMLSLGLKHTEIIHRFDMGCNDADNLAFNPVIFLNSKGDTLFKQAASVSSYYKNYDFERRSKGAAHYNGKGQKLKGPKIFTRYNVMSLQNSHDFLIALMYPQLVPDSIKLQIDSSNYSMLLKAMSSYPRESDYPKYDAKKYEDSYKKYLLLADYHDSIKEDTLRIFNVVGQSYGWLSDCAYFVDFKNGIDFFLSAVIYTNANNTMNDGRYEYKSLGFPFLSKLGRLIYDYDKTRHRETRPSLSRFKLH